MSVGSTIFGNVRASSPLNTHLRHQTVFAGVNIIGELSDYISIGINNCLYDQINGVLQMKVQTNSPATQYLHLPTNLCTKLLLLGTGS